ncbi:helix-turn-helix domain-containing protein [Weissella confusa]|nr:helix-turn-helix domain-containing protein [Weissella confusa]MBJ7666583.1 helix-turn-helix domain-containing protein [Weissella confusa]
MMKVEWTNEQALRAYEIRRKGKTYQEVAEQLNREFGITPTASSVNHKILEIERKNEINYDCRTTTSINADGSQSSSTLIKMTVAQSKSAEYVLKAHGFNPYEWRLKQATNNLWQQNSTKSGLVDLYQSKIVVEPKKEYTLVELANVFAGKVETVRIERNKHQSERNLVIPLADMHFGITKQEDIAGKLSELLEIIDRGYNHIVIENIGDLFHSDQINRTQTVNATQLDEVDMVSAINEAMSFFDAVVSKALENASRVFIKHVGGNHSFDLEYMMMRWLQERFPQVAVDVNNRYRTAYMLVNVAIMIQHGDVAKKNVGLLFATEYPKLWGNSNSQEIHRGHLHNERTTDEHGVITRQFGTPKPAEGYEVKNGWTGSGKELYALEYDEDKLRVEYHI